MCPNLTYQNWPITRSFLVSCQQNTAPAVSWVCTQSSYLPLFTLSVDLVLLCAINQWKINKISLSANSIIFRSGSLSIEDSHFGPQLNLSWRVGGWVRDDRDFLSPALKSEGRQVPVHHPKKRGKSHLSWAECSNRVWGAEYSTNSVWCRYEIHFKMW